MSAESDTGSPLAPPKWLSERSTAHLVAAGAVACSAAIILLALLQYSAPRNYQSLHCFNHPGIRQFRDMLFSANPREMTPGGFICFFRALLCLAWVGYAAAVFAALIRPMRTGRVVLGLGVAVCLLTAVLWPASLTWDPYSYIGYARMELFYGINPHNHSFQELRGLADPVVGFSNVALSSPYGPLWTLLSMGIVWPLRTVGLWWQVVATKLLAAAALILTALTGRAVCERLSPGRGNVTLLAILLNPLFLIEAPGNGHNDMVMMSLLLAGTLLWLKGRHAAGAVAVGLSAAVKVVTLALVPWLVLSHMQGRKLRDSIPVVAAVLLLAILPSAVCYLPFWESTSTFSGLREQWEWAAYETGASNAGRAERWLALHGVSQTLAHAVGFVAGNWYIAAMYILLSVWLGIRRTEAGWMTAWAIFTGTVFLVGMRHWFPWYLTWPWAVTLTRWDRTHSYLSVICLCVGLILTMGYAIPMQ